MSVLIYIFATLATVGFSKMVKIRNVLADDKIIRYTKKNKKQYMGAVILSFLPLFLVASLRYNVGTDYKAYLYYQVPLILQNELNDKFELFFRWIVRFSVNILGNEQFIFVIFSFVFLLFLFIAIYKYSEDIPLSMLLLLLTVTFNWSLNIMRQSIAAAIFAYSLQYIKDRKILKYILCVGIAYGFHKTSIILIPIYFILRIQFNKRYKGILALLIFAFVSEYAVQYVAELMVRFNTSYVNYIGSTYEGMNGGILLVVNAIILIYMTVIVDKKEYRNGSWFNMFYSIQIITIASGFASSFIPNGSRMIMMFMPVQIILIPYTLNHVKHKYIRYKSLLKYGMLLLYTVFFVWMIVYKNYGSTLPYHFIF